MENNISIKNLTLTNGYVNSSTIGSFRLANGGGMSIVNANYIYLCIAPIVNNPFIFTNQWPWYIVGIDIVAILHFYIIYYIFNYKYRKK